MKSQLFQIIPIFLVNIISTVHSVRIPDDIEILDGYRFDSQNILNPESAFFGSSGPRLFKAIRDKRSTGKYEILESPGLRSHFRFDNSMKPDTDTDTAVKQERRFKRDAEDEQEEEEKNLESVDKLPTEELPTPEKFVSGNFRDSHKSMEQWGKSPYTNEFSKVQKEEDDSQYIQADASTINEGIKARAPRVNFITQQNKPDVRDQRPLVPGNDLRDLYKIPNPNERWTPEPPSTRSYDQYQQVYNRDMLMTPPTPNYRYQYGEYPEYYDERKNYNNYYDSAYPTRGVYPRDSMYREMPPRDRYDYFEARYDGYNRDYWPLQGNDINERTPMMGNRNRRIIYYANLPEVVRTPGYSDMNYNSYGAYYPTYRDSYPSYDPYRSSRLVREREFLPKTSSPHTMTPMPPPSMQKEMDPNKYSSVPLKISSSLRVENQRPDRRMFTEVTDTREGRPSFQDGIEDRKRSYLSRYN